MLRHYDECGLFRPAQVDVLTGYRLYSAEQLPVLGRIIFLRDIGCGIAEISDVMKSWEDSSISALLENKRGELNAEIAERLDRLKRIEQAECDAGRERLSVACGITLKKVPDYRVLSLRKIIPDYFSEGVLWHELSCFMHKNGIKESPPELNLAIYHDLEYKDSDVDVEVCANADVFGADADGFSYRIIEEIPEMASSFMRGPYENIAGAFFSLAGWLQQNKQYEMAGTSRQICHRGPWNESDPVNYLVEIQIPVKKRLTLTSCDGLE